MKRWMFSFLLALAMLGSTAGAVLAAEGGEHNSGVPSSPLYTVNEGLISALASLAIFAVLLVILGKKAWGPILQGLQAREDKIRKDIADAEEARAKAEALLRDYNKQLADAEARGRDILNKAKTDADALAAQIRTRGQQEAEEARERATREIEEAKTQAIHEIHQQAATLATSVAEKIIRKSLNANDYRDLVDQSIGELQEMKS